MSLDLSCASCTNIVVLDHEDTTCGGSTNKFFFLAEGS